MDLSVRPMGGARDPCRRRKYHSRLPIVQDDRAYGGGPGGPKDDPFGAQEEPTDPIVASEDPTDPIRSTEDQTEPGMRDLSREEPTVPREAPTLPWAPAASWATAEPPPAARKHDALLLPVVVFVTVMLACIGAFVYSETRKPEPPPMDPTLAAPPPPPKPQTLKAPLPTVASPAS
jgi:hypothetical protein